MKTHVTTCVNGVVRGTDKILRVYIMESPDGGLEMRLNLTEHTLYVAQSLGYRLHHKEIVGTLEDADAVYARCVEEYNVPYKKDVVAEYDAAFVKDMVKKEDAAWVGRA